MPSFPVLILSAAEPGKGGNKGWNSLSCIFPDSPKSL